MKLIHPSSSSSSPPVVARGLSCASLLFALCAMAGPAQAHGRAEAAETEAQRRHHSCQSHRPHKQEPRLAQRLETVHAAVVHAARTLGSVQTRASTEELYEARERLAHARTHRDNRAWSAAHRALDRAELLVNRVAYAARKARRDRAREQRAKHRFKVALQLLDKAIAQARWRTNLAAYESSPWRGLVVARRARAEALRLAREGSLRPATAKLSSAKRALEQRIRRRDDRRACARPEGRRWTARG